MVISDNPSFALLFDARAESWRSCCSSFGASGGGRGQSLVRNWRTMFTFLAGPLLLHIQANLVRDGWIEALLLGHFLLNLCPR